jgi:hypothetical protein
MGVVSRVVVIFTACIKLAINELPVIFSFVLVVIEGNASSEVLDGDDAILGSSDIDAVTVSFSRLIDGVGENLKYGMLTALQPVRAEDDGRTLTYTVRALQKLDTVIIIYLCFFRHSAWGFLSLGIFCILRKYFSIEKFPNKVDLWKVY